MSDFQLYFRLGIDHITDLNGYDHMVFLVALSAVYLFKQYKKLFWIVTAFTLAHSTTLALAGLDVVSVNGVWIEFLIPATILLTGLFNLTRWGQDVKSSIKIYLAAIFGLIHGFGFSLEFKKIIVGESDVLWILLPFNAGVEVGQIIVLLAILTISFVFQRILSVKTRDWNFIVSGAVIGISSLLLLSNWP